MRDDQGSLAVDRPPRILFLTPFHFGTAAHDDDFDRLAEKVLGERVEHEVVASHLAPFERDAATYDADQEAAVIEAVRTAGSQGFDAIVIACHYDPAVQAARDVSAVPVVGPLELMTGFAKQFGPRFAVITDVLEAEPIIAGLVESYGHGASCGGVTAIGWEGDAILDDTWGAAKAVDDVVDMIAERGNVQSVVIACTIVSAAYELHRASFPKRGVVVLNSNLVTTKAAAALARM
jgi:Asp/Glu/hydantoin racemase